MARDTILFDINETVLDLATLRPKFTAVFDDAGYRLVAFTNSSLQLAASQIANAGLGQHFDMIVSVEETGSFKPDAEVYRFAARKVDREMRDLRLIAAHDWETHGALTAGSMAAYIDRTGAPYHPLYKRPTIFARTMGEAVEGILEEDMKS